MTDSNEQKLFWETVSFSASQRIPRIVWNPPVYCRLHNSPAHFPTLSKVNLINIIPSYFYKIISSSHPRQVYKEVFFFKLPRRNHVRISFSLIPATYTTHLISLDWSANREARIMHCSTDSVTSSSFHLNPNIDMFISTPFSLQHSASALFPRSNNIEAYWYNIYQLCLAFGFSYQKVIYWKESPLRNSRERTVAL